MDSSSFAYMAFIVIVVVIGQGVLWAWIGYRAMQVVPWWPIKFGDAQSAENQQLQAKVAAAEAAGSPAASPATEKNPLTEEVNPLNERYEGKPKTEPKTEPRAAPKAETKTETKVESKPESAPAKEEQDEKTRAE